MRQRQRWRLWPQATQPTASSHQKPRLRHGVTLPRSPNPIPAALVQTSGRQHCEGTHFCCFKPTSLWYFFRHRWLESLTLNRGLIVKNYLTPWNNGGCDQCSDQNICVFF